MAYKRAFIQCDVFTNTATKGNALAVVLDGKDISTEMMASFAAWTNLAETTFLLPPDDPAADYKLRIFTPKREMLFAGHPTLGSCAAWLHTGGTPKEPGLVRQECGIGIVEIDLTGDMPAFIAPVTEVNKMRDAVQIKLIQKLNLDRRKIIDCAVLNNGPEWHVFHLDSAQTVLDVDSSLVRWPEEQGIGLIGAHSSGSECDYEVRMLAPSSGMIEDPITGSLNSAMAHWFNARGLLAKSMTVAQGTCLDRVGRVYIKQEDNAKGRIFVGGETQILISGTVVL